MTMAPRQTTIVQVDGHSQEQHAIPVMVPHVIHTTIVLLAVPCLAQVAARLDHTMQRPHVLVITIAHLEVA